MTGDILRRSLAGEQRVAHYDDDLLEVEPASVAAGGLVGSYRVKNRPAVELLERRGHLSYRHARAARRLYRCHALGIAGARETGGGCSAHTPGGYSDLVLAAATVYRESRVAVGPVLWPVVYNVCILDQTVSGYAEERFASRSGRMIGLVMSRLRDGLERLAAYHRDADEADGL